MRGWRIFVKMGEGMERACDDVKGEREACRSASKGEAEKRRAGRVNLPATREY